MSSSGWGEPGGEEGKGKGVSLLRSGRMTKVGSGFHPMLCRLLGNKEGWGPLCGRTGNESGTKLGQYSSSVGCWRVRLYVSRKRARRVARSMRDLISA